MLAVVFHDQDTHFVSDDPIIETVRKAEHQEASFVFTDDPPAFGCSQNHRDAAVKFVEKLGAKAFDRLIVKPRCSHHLGFGRRMVGKFHSIALRAACFAQRDPLVEMM